MRHKKKQKDCECPFFLSDTEINEGDCWVLLDRVRLLMHRFAQVSLEQAISIHKLYFPPCCFQLFQRIFFLHKTKHGEKTASFLRHRILNDFHLVHEQNNGIKLLWEKTGQTETLIDTVTFKWWQAWRLGFRTCGRAPCRDCTVRRCTSGASEIMLIILLRHKKSFIAAL